MAGPERPADRANYIRDFGIPVRVTPKRSGAEFEVCAIYEREPNEIDNGFDDGPGRVKRSNPFALIYGDYATMRKIRFDDVIDLTDEDGFARRYVAGGVERKDDGLFAMISLREAKP